MPFVSFHIYGAEGTCWTKIFASATTYASLCVDNRNHALVASFAFIFLHGNHLYSTRRTMAFAIAAPVAACCRQTVLLDPDGMTYLHRRLLLACYGAYGSCGAHIRAFCTLGAAIPTLVGHLWLHQSGKVRRGAQHIIGAN